VRISFPPIISGISISEELSSANFAFKLTRSLLPGAKDITGSLTGLETANSDWFINYSSIKVYILDLELEHIF
jgi:hypothetical protein